MKIGLDWGGTKLEAIALDPITNEELVRNRIDSPKEDYQKILNTVCSLIKDTAGQTKDITVGIGMPGSLHPKTGFVQVSNTKALEGQDVKTDIQKKLGIEVKIANDADCLALSEAIDGAGKDYNTVFAVILGTGVGAGYVVGKQLIVGPNKLTGEWGQNPIPGPMDDYEKSIKRHCGRVGAIEVFLSGPGLENWFEYKTGIKKNSKDVVKLFRSANQEAVEVMNKYFERLARAFSTFVNILDPDIIVCGGGMSEIDEIYQELPQLIVPYLASDIFLTPVVKAEHGSSSGVRGAAHLW